MRVAITGVTGMIGSALARRLVQAGHTVVPISRTRAAGRVAWDPMRGVLDPAALEGLHAVIHLAGAPIAQRRWTRARKRELRDSRVLGTALIAETIAGLRKPPAVLVSASAVGIYGDTGDSIVDEGSPTGDDFLGRLGREWEAAAEPARAIGVRVVHPRTGIVLSPRGGALARMLPIFRLGLGGRLGSGRQWMSWIALEDVIRAVELMLAMQELNGPVNLTAPEPVTNAEFAAALGKALRRPAVVPAPAWALRLALGELAEAALLSSQRVRPARLLDVAFQFNHPVLGSALAELQDT
ncbi:MAG TPA: TIGR01777 family oxidoreductase [Gemmatimonadales bacterium]|nr:TIGR01777 family oxidoreductase [Gemmatimonadales bacterium]